MAFLDDLVASALRERLLAPERLVECLSALAQRRQERNAAMDQRLVSLKSRLIEVEDRLRRLYRSIEDGIAEIDDLLGDRIAELKVERWKTQAAVERATSQTSVQATIHSDKIAAFSRLMSDLLRDGETQARKAYLRTLVSAIVVGDKCVKIIGSKDALHAAVLGKAHPQSVRGSGPEWRTRDASKHLL